MEKLSSGNISQLEANEKNSKSSRAFEINIFEEGKEEFENVENVSSKNNFSNSNSNDLIETDILSGTKSLEKAKNKVSNYLLNRNRENDKQILSKDAEDSVIEKKSGKIDKEKLEALQFMCGIMDECTHLKNFSVPVSITELN